MPLMITDPTATNIAHHGDLSLEWALTGGKGKAD
jgi:hypothetical protein